MVKVSIGLDKFGMNIPDGCVQMYYAVKYADGRVKTVATTFFPSLNEVDKYECEITSQAMLILGMTFPSKHYKN